MKLLAVDTATPCQSVALLDDEKVVACSEKNTEGSHATWLIPTIDQLLTSNGLKLAHLDGLAVAIGPGSFTGLRVGLATMLGFRSVTGLPLAAVSSLEAMAWNYCHLRRTLCPMVKGRTGEVYWALYQWTEAGVLHRLTEEQVGSVEQVAASLQGPTLLFGDGWPLYRGELLRLLGPKSSYVDELPVDPPTRTSVTVGRAGLELLGRGEVAPMGIAPRYIQRSEAEVNWERGGIYPGTMKIKRPGRRRTV